MPKFTNTPPSDPRGYALPIVRTPAGKKFQATITSDNLIGCNTHFWGGKTVPCEAPECDACKHGVPYRWHAYTSAVLHPQGLHVLYEVTALAAEALVTFRKSNGTLRGCLVDAYRWRGAANGRIVMRCERTTQTLDSLPTPPDIIHCLSIIWQLPADKMLPQEQGPYGRNLSLHGASDSVKHHPNTTGNDHDAA